MVRMHRVANTVMQALRLALANRRNAGLETEEAIEPSVKMSERTSSVFGTDQPPPGWRINTRTKATSSLHRREVMN